MDESGTFSRLDEVRRHRAELREAVITLEHALAAPVPGREEVWVERVHVALVELAGDVRDHVALTEGPDGLYASVRASTPRLGGWVDRLTAEHADLISALDQTLAIYEKPGATVEAYEVRDLATDLLSALVRHRQRGADLVYEAYTVDIGGSE